MLFTKADKSHKYSTQISLVYSRITFIENLFRYIKNMKKLLYIILLAIFATIITSCDTMDKKDKEDNKPLSFPTLKYCNPEMLKSDKSFICIQRQEGADLIETNIKFDTDSFTLNNQAKAVLNKLFAYLKLTGTTRFTIKGYAGKIESDLITDKNLLTESNIRLSKK